MLSRAIAIATAITCAACAAPQFARVGTPVVGTTIDRVELTWSNVYLVRSGDAIALVDSGSPVDRDALAAALAARGVDPKQIRVVVITHAHADHAGLARWLQTRGAAIVLGAADARLAARGENDPLPATGLIAGWLAPVFMFPFEPFTPDLAIDHEIDLGAYDLPALRVVPVPGHTAGSLAVVVGDEAIAGDLFKGGHLAKLGVHVPSEHFYQADPAADHRAVVALLDRGVRRFDIGHGGPVDADAVRAWVRTADDERVPRVASIELAANGELARTAGADDGASGVLRARFGVARPLGYFGGFDVRAGELGGAHLDVDVHALGLALRDRTGMVVAITAGVGFGGVRGLGATHVPIEISAELPAGAFRVLARAGLGWRLGGDAYTQQAFGAADEATALVGIRLGGEHAWGRVRAGRGPFVAATYRKLGADALFGLALGLELSAGD